MGNVATPWLEIVASPTGAGASFSVCRADTKPESSMTFVVRPLERLSIWATGLTDCDEELEELEAEPLLLSSLPHAATPRVSAPAMPRTASFWVCMVERLPAEGVQTSM